MLAGFCHSGSWGSVGNMSGWSVIGLIIYLTLAVGLIIGLTLLVIRALRHARVQDALVPNVTGGSPSRETLQARYTQGDITREQYELGKQVTK